MNMKNVNSLNLHQSPKSLWQRCQLGLFQEAWPWLAACHLRRGNVLTCRSLHHFQARDKFRLHQSKRFCCQQVGRRGHREAIAVESLMEVPQGYRKGWFPCAATEFVFAQVPPQDFWRLHGFLAWRWWHGCEPQDHGSKEGQPVGSARCYPPNPIYPPLFFHGDAAYNASHSHSKLTVSEACR